MRWAVTKETWIQVGKLEPARLGRNTQDRIRIHVVLSKPPPSMMRYPEGGEKVIHRRTRLSPGPGCGAAEGEFSRSRNSRSCRTSYQDESAITGGTHEG